MALNRIQFSASSDGSSPYTLPINPSTLKLNDDSDPTMIEVLDGGRVIQNKVYDDRPIIMSWTGLPTGLTGLSTMLTTLRGYTNLVRYVHYQDADYRVTTSEWDKVRVANLKVSTRQGGTIRYDITLTLIPEQ